MLEEQNPNMNPLTMSGYKEPIVVEKEKYGLWELGHHDGRVARAEQSRLQLEQTGAASVALAMSKNKSSNLSSARSFTPSVAQLNSLPKWTPARWTGGHWTAVPLEASELPVTERYKRAATEWGNNTVMEAARRDARKRDLQRKIITNPFQ